MSRAQRERHCRVPVDSEHQKGNGFTNGSAEARTTQQNKKYSKGPNFVVLNFRKPRLHQVLDEMTKALHISEKSQKFPVG